MEVLESFVAKKIRECQHKNRFTSITKEFEKLVEIDGCTSCGLYPISLSKPYK